ncbi:MAG: KEOPS complex subunit Pcc1 [Candidatus Nezhaarchaeota archaeon]|nr:KEOPS complex subunit Pcc1 [Candidatus Nezhaarchaeota archaeon]
MSCHQHSATIEIFVEDKALKKAICSALKPEVEGASKGFNVKATFEGEKLIIRFYSKSLSRLRAVLNSYLRWTNAICEVVSGDEDASTNTP